MTKDWYYRDEDFVRGPMLPPALKQCADKGLISRDTKVRKGMNGKWMKASQVRGLFARLEPFDPNQIEEIEDELDPEAWGDHRDEESAQEAVESSANPVGAFNDVLEKSTGPSLPDSSDFAPPLTSFSPTSQPKRRSGEPRAPREPRRQRRAATEPSGVDWDAVARNTDLVVRRSLLAALAVWMLFWVISTLAAFMRESPEKLSLVADIAQRMHVPTFYFGSFVAGALVIWFVSRK